MRISNKTTKMVYKNYKGEVLNRTVTPMGLRWGKTKWHPDDCWLLKAFDHDRQAVREFALSDTNFAEGGL